MKIQLFVSLPFVSASLIYRGRQLDFEMDYGFALDAIMLKHLKNGFINAFLVALRIG